MIKSMTGYGVAGFENEQLVIQVEIRTLNSKMLDLSIRSPRQFADKEAEIRNRVQAILDRGKVSVSIDFLAKGNQNLPVQLNEDLFKTYYSTFERLAASVGETSTDLFKLALQAPQVMVTTTMDREDSEDWAQVRLVVEEALVCCEAFRVDEGEEEDAEDQPGEGESEDALGHERRLVIVQQGQGDERHGEAEGAGDRELELVAHQARQEGIRMDGVRGGGGLAHGVSLVRAFIYRLQPEDFRLL